MRTRAVTWFAMLVAAVLVGPACASAAEATSPEAYSLDFTLPTAGKSGCTVCHDDPNLVRVRDGRLYSLYVDTAMLADSAHATVPCTGCHVDFAYTIPHDNAAGGDWRAIAKLSCKSCHKNEFADMTAGAHSPVKQAGSKAKAVEQSRETSSPPLCGDCHGGHDIPPLEDNPAGQAELHARGIQMCGQCHEAETTTYKDYYHGAAYQAGAKDAPACWDCHDAHKVLPADDRNSPVHPSRLGDTCKKCHSDPNEDYISYAQLVHKREEVRAAVPLYAFWEGVRSRVYGAAEAVRSWF